MRHEDIELTEHMVEDLHLKGAELLIYATIRAYGGESGVALPYDRLARFWGLNQATVVKAVQRLEAKGFISHVRDTRGHGADAPNIYRIEA